MTEWTDWIAHKPGDPCPISGAASRKYQLKYRDGEVATAEGKYEPPSFWMWGPIPEDTDCEIIAYRTLKEERDYE